jgi:O-antigen/teichoic acid export membrane protein
VSDRDPDDGLLRRVSRAMFWNASLLPAIMAVNLGAAVLIRRGYGLESGIYDVALGVINTLLAHSGLGVPLTMVQFVPGLERSGGRAAVARFIRRVAVLRLALVAVAVLLLNLFAGAVADALHLSDNGVWLLRVASVLALLRAGSDLAVRTLQALLAHARANLVQLAQAITLLAAVAWALSSRASMTVLFIALTGVAAGITIGAGLLVRRETQVLPAMAAASPDEVTWSRFWRFSLFMYVFEVSHYFETPGFASPALAAATGGAATVALFNVAFQFPMMVVVFILAGLQGVYRPLFARVMAEKDPKRVRTAFAEITKVQAALLIPSGVGLGLLLPDYIPLLFTDRFVDAVPLARILCVFIFFESLFNLGNILLSIDHRYRIVFAAHALKIGAAPVFLWLAVRGDLILATAMFGAGRVLASGVGHLAARRLYGVRFPVAFTARVGLSTLLMAIVVGAGQRLLPTSWAAVTALTLVGLAVTLLGMRWFAVLGPREIDLLRRAGLPGSGILLRWLSNVPSGVQG